MVIVIIHSILKSITDNLIKPQVPTFDDVQKLIKEQYGVNHDYKTVWTIVRKKLDLNYGKPFIKYSERPEDAEEQLKKT